ncbi:uncharacterized protein BX663DRAFT_203307 [Cokeromyces recurvatus]|uniref:uncharacterized protein n=1 Tax=Cokeromyces recurvatus TaxID=90255 RepID=UPI00221E56FB|nr:uncharacterized protein BX663DRAFT_203307 [Cokeromyces recurvatus]KAI7906721.1 hypothetical protein BX663DRAFT_203307 [Cokeromyces recurvatus]
MKAWDYLSGWTNFALPKRIQKHLYKFVLRKAIGQFLQKELDLENFDLALINGNLELRDLDLNLQFINKLLMDTPFILEKGSLAMIKASIPWSKLLSGDISFKIQGLHLTFCPTKKTKKPSTAKEDVEHIMSSSLHFADDFLRTEVDSQEEFQESFQQREEGLEVLTKVIDKMLSRVKVDMIDTLVRITHKSSVLSASVDISIPRISYFDETPEFNTSAIDNSMPSIANETIKIITMASPQIWLRESISENELEETQFFEANEGDSTLFQSYYCPNNDGSTTSKASKQPYEALLFTTLDEKNWIRLKLRSSVDNMSIKQIDFLITRIQIILSPIQIAFFMNLLNTMSVMEESSEKVPALSSQINQPPLTTTNMLLEDLDMFNDKQYAEPSLYKPTNISLSSCGPSSSYSLEQKIKVQMPLIEIFLLTDNTPIMEPRRDHIRFAIENLNLRLQRFPEASSSIIDIRIANIGLDEWIAKPSHFIKPYAFVSPRSQTQYETYIPIIQFDNRIKHDYRHEDKFPAYYPQNTKSDLGQDHSVRIRIEQKQETFAEVVSDEQDTNVDIQPFKIIIDPRTLDRLENYVNVIIDDNKQTKERTHSHSERRQSVFDDLEIQENIKKQKVRIRCAFIRVLLNVPDMSQITTREEFNDRIHVSQLSVDIKKLVGSWSSTVMDDHSSSIESEDYFSNKPSKHPNKLNIELNYINVFMQHTEDEMAKCWFTMKTVQESNQIFDTLSPTIEITIQDSQIYPTTSTRSGYFGAGSDIPDNLFNFLSKNENFNSEQKLHLPMDEQAESAMIFKQRTIETSMFAINCHFPQADMNLTKPLWDKIQIIQNDLLLWQPRFLLRQKDTIPANHDGHSSSSSVLGEPIDEDDSSQMPSLFSIVACMSNGVWDISTVPEHTYRLQFSEFKYFAAIKHLGKNENITTLDIEDLDLFDISNTEPIYLLYKTIPKKIHSKRSTSMISLISKLSSTPKLNKLTKLTSVVICNLCWKATLNVDFVTELVDFQKAPEEMVFIDPPTQYTKVYACILETSIDYEPIYSPSRAVIILDGIQIITDILAGQPIMTIKTYIQSTELYLVDDRNELNLTQVHELLEGKKSDTRNYWITLGFTNTLAFQNVEFEFKLKLDTHFPAPSAYLSLVSTDLIVAVSADAFQTLLNLVTYISNDGDCIKRQPSSSKEKPQPRPTYPFHDMLASIDETAFKSNPIKISPPTLIDMPDMEEFSFVEEFYHAEHDHRPPKPRRNRHRATSDDIVRVLIPEDEAKHCLDVIEDFFGVERQVNSSESPVDITKALLSLRMSNVNIIWKLYDGYEWNYIRTDQGPPHNTPLIEIKLTSISLDFDLMPAIDPTAFFWHLLVKDVEIIDHIQTSAWKKFLGYMSSEERERDDCMVDVELISLRPVQNDSQQEFRLKVKVLPLRLYVDQDAMLFLQKYFSFDTSCLRSTYAANQAILTPENEDNSGSGSGSSSSGGGDSGGGEDESSPQTNKPGLFFQYVDIYPVTLKVDYKPKAFNLKNFREGQIAELVNLFRLDGSQLSLNHLKFTGIHGLDNLLDRLGQEWLPHILNTQKIKMVSGVSPVRSLMNLSTGVADLVLLPIQQYRKDGRIVKGIQRGTSSFARATAVEAIKFSSKMASGTQFILEHADGFFSSPNTTTASMTDHNHPLLSSQSEQNKATSEQTAVFTAPTTENKVVIRSVPISVIKPMIGLTASFQHILTALRSSIDPVMRLQSEDKYKKPK